jgi:hypothetical protein
MERHAVIVLGSLALFNATIVCMRVSGCVHTQQSEEACEKNILNNEGGVEEIIL